MKRIIGIVLVMAVLLCGCSSQKIQPIPSVIAEFSPNLQSYLEAIPIKTHSSVRTSMALTCLNVSPKRVQICVSPYFPTFTPKFQNTLLAHEYLNIIGAESVDLEQFNVDLQEWYNDPAYGNNTSAGNYFKYILWFNLYKDGVKEQSTLNEKIDQFAFVGDTLLSITPSYRNQLPDSIQAYYKGILN